MLDKHENALCAETYRRRMCVCMCEAEPNYFFKHPCCHTVAVDVLSFLIRLKAIAENVMLLLSLFQNVQKTALEKSILFAFFNTN